MKITKSLCEEIVCKLVEPITHKIKENEKAISEIVKQLILSKCPKEVFKLWEDKSEYLNVRHNVNVTYLGQHYYAHFDCGLPLTDRYFVVTDVKIANKIQEVVNENITLSNKKRNLSKELEVTILKLGTFNRVKEQFPEAGAFLPTEQKMEVSLNIQDTRDKLKDLP